MARARKSGDTARNARRRYVRQGKRYLQKADNAIGAARNRYLILAQDALENAVSLYSENFDTSKAEKPIRELAHELNVDISKIKPTQNPLQKVSESYEALAKNVQGTGRRPLKEREAKAILKNKNVKNRFYAGLIDIWEGLPAGERNEAIMEYFGVDSIFDVMGQLEEAGIDIYSAPSSEEMYETGALQIARYAATR